MSGGITSSALLVTLFSKKIGFTPQEYRLFTLTKKSLMNSERKKSAVICMQRMFRAQKTSAANVDGWGWSFFSSLYQKLLTGHPITSDKGTVRSWITKEWSEQRKIFKAVSQDTREIQDPLEQATEVFENVAEIVEKLQSACDSNNQSYEACHQQLEKSEENLQRISAMISTLETLLQSQPSPTTKAQ